MFNNIGCWICEAWKKRKNDMPLQFHVKPPTQCVDEYLWQSTLSYVWGRLDLI